MPLKPVARGLRAASWQLGANWAWERISAKNGSVPSESLSKMRSPSAQEIVRSDVAAIHRIQEWLMSRSSQLFARVVLGSCLSVLPLGVACAAERPAAAASNA